MSDKNVFERAVDVIHERGWTQGRLKSADGEVCLMGALWTARVGSTTGRYTDEDWCLIAAAERHFAEVNECLEAAPWNDDPHRTVEDVLLALKEAASTWTGA